MKTYRVDISVWVEAEDWFHAEDVVDEILIHEEECRDFSINEIVEVD